MRTLLIAVIVLALASGLASGQCTITLGEGGVLSGNLITSMIAMFGLTFGDEWTLCIAPGVYELDPSDGWPVTLPWDYTPAIVGSGGADSKVSHSGASGSRSQGASWPAWSSPTAWWSTAPSD